MRRQPRLPARRAALLPPMATPGRQKACLSASRSPALIGRRKSTIPSAPAARARRSGSGLELCSAETLSRICRCRRIAVTRRLVDLACGSAAGAGAGSLLPPPPLTMAPSSSGPLPLAPTPASGRRPPSGLRRRPRCPACPRRRRHRQQKTTQRQRLWPPSQASTTLTVGLQHYRRANLEDGTAVELVREPDNTHDAQAIAVKVHHKTLHGKYTQLPLGEDRTYPGRSEPSASATHNTVGMLAFPQAHELSPLLDAGACTVANSRIVGRRGPTTSRTSTIFTSRWWHTPRLRRALRRPTRCMAESGSRRTSGRLSGR